ncbi:hypothetical protein QYE76_022575 [Lolium multiflorum]|uniref:DUF4216 domain-containing protein n=1 Tax=Lolium multiflorum TaxID=4521 RepID=A0AAD8VU78_LOLMU|nr:hypothetical protein QYE76_022575 [Lolium multiflorum]
MKMKVNSMWPEMDGSHRNQKNSPAAVADVGDDSVPGEASLLDSGCWENEGDEAQLWMPMEQRGTHLFGGAMSKEDIKTVEDHCNCSGMSMTYTRWTRHGEGFSDDEGRDRNDDGAYDSDNDEEEDNGDCYVDDSSSMIDELQKSGNKGPDLPNIEFRQELGGRGVRDIEETVQREFAGWFANHVRQLDNASEDLKSLAAGPDRRVVVYAGCNVKGARFRTLTRDKDLKTQNSGVATKGSFGDADETEYYGVLQEVLELQYGTNKHGDRSVYLFRCDWFDLASRGSKIKDDGYFKSVNTSVLWFKNSPFILASQAETCFYLEDTKFGDPWKVVQKFSHRHVYDVPELEDGNDDAFVRNEDAYQEDEGSVDHTFHDVVDLDEEAEVEAEEDDHRADEVVRIHDARTIRELENGEDSPNVDMDMSEDELENEEDSLILEENIHDDEGKNSEEDSDVD